MVRGRPKATLILTEADRQELERLARRPTTSQAKVLRATVILQSAKGLSNTHVAERLGINNSTVSKWRKRFIAMGPSGLMDAPRTGAPRSVSDADVEAVVMKTLDELPKGATHWSTRSMAAATGMSQTAVSRIWRAFGLEPHVKDTFKLSSDPFFVDKVRDIVGLYMSPPERAIVPAMDEESQIQAPPDAADAADAAQPGRASHS